MVQKQLSRLFSWDHNNRFSARGAITTINYVCCSSHQSIWISVLVGDHELRLRRNDEDRKYERLKSVFPLQPHFWSIFDVRHNPRRLQQAEDCDTVLEVGVGALLVLTCCWRLACVVNHSWRKESVQVVQTHNTLGDYISHQALYCFKAAVRLNTLDVVPSVASDGIFKNSRFVVCA